MIPEVIGFSLTIAVATSAILAAVHYKNISEAQSERASVLRELCEDLHFEVQKYLFIQNRPNFESLERAEKATAKELRK